MQRVPMTLEGHASLMDELRHLKSVERIKISKEIGVAIDHGDLKENAEYHAAKDKQGMIEARIATVEDRLSRAEVIDTSKLGGPQVAFGAYVVIEDMDGKESSYRIVGQDEANIEEGTISVTSPMARAMISREAGDEVKVRAPGGERLYEVVQVRWTAN